MPTKTRIPMTSISTKAFLASLDDLETTIRANTATLRQLLRLRAALPGVEEEETVLTRTIRLKQLQSEENSLAFRNDRVTIQIRVVFLKVGEIETQKEQYNADVFMQFRWREPRLDQFSYQDIANADLKKFWNPELYVENSLGNPTEEVWTHVSMNDNNEAYLYERRRVKGCFAETLELADFPFDVQDLTVTVSSHRPDTELELVKDVDEVSAINPSSEQQEWRLHKQIESSIHVTLQEYSSTRQNHPSFSVTCRAARRPGYFYWNVFLVMFFISSLSFATFSVRHTLPQFRLQLSFTLLLTSVAFKFVINQSLPRISYLTYLDKYVLASMVMLVVVCLWHSLITLSYFSLADESFAFRAEKWAFLGLLGTYLFLHFCFIFWLYIDPCRRRRKMNKLDKDFERDRQMKPMKLGNLELYALFAQEEEERKVRRR